MVRPFTQRVCDRVKCETVAFRASWSWERTVQRVIRRAEEKGGQRGSRGGGRKRQKYLEM